MNYKPISEEPKQKNRTMIFICIESDGRISCCSDVWNSWDDANNFRKEKFNGWSSYQYTHWAYLNTPKNK